MQVQAEEAFFDTIAFSSDEIVELFAMKTLLGTWRFEIDGDVALVSSNICRILEVPADSDAISLDVILQNVHPDDNAMVFACFEKAVEAGTSLECLYRIVRPEGYSKNVLTVGRVRVNVRGRREIFGATYEVCEAIRSIGYVD